MAERRQLFKKMAQADGTSMNQFLVMAAAEKLTAIQTAETWPRMAQLGRIHYAPACSLPLSIRSQRR